MEFLTTQIRIGLESPVRVLHFSDTHLTRADLRDGERKVNLGDSRYGCFPNAEEVLQFASAKAQALDLPIVHTGDLCDFVSHANNEAVRAFTDEHDVFMVAGNHEFSLYVGEAWEDEAYKAQAYDSVQKVFPNDLTFASRVVNGVNFVSLMNGYYYVTEYQFKRMKREVKRGLPIVLMCHVPLYTPKHCESNLRSNNNYASYVMGAPREITSNFRLNPNYPADHWKQCRKQQYSTDTTLEFIDWLKKQPELKAILCGHCHHFYEEQFSPTAVQYIVGAGYQGAAYEIEFV